VIESNPDVPTVTVIAILLGLEACLMHHQGIMKTAVGTLVAQVITLIAVSMALVITTGDLLDLLITSI
jgi:hypothetical protein